MTVNVQEIEKARERIRGLVDETPLIPARFLEKRLKAQAPIFFKLENLQRTGSFKVRGSANKFRRLLEEGRKPEAVVTASAGNHAQAVAYTANYFKIPTTVVMPTSSPLVKVMSTKSHGAQVVLHGLSYDESYDKAQALLREQPGSVYVHAYADPDIICGQGTVALEMHQQLADHGVKDDAIEVVVPVGGAGLISGVATALKALRPQSRVYGVACDAAPSMADSFHAGKIVASKGKMRTLAEGLAIKSVSQLNFDLVKRLVDAMTIVDDLEIAEAVTLLMDQAKLVVEGAGAAGVAAVLSGKIKIQGNKPVVIVIPGGNIDMNLVSNILERGFSRSGRWLSMGFFVDDQPGNLARIASRIGELQANVLEIFHDRLRPDCPLGQTYIRFTLETRGPDHIVEMTATLKREDFRFEILPHF